MFPSLSRFAVVTAAWSLVSPSIAAAGVTDTERASGVEWRFRTSGTLSAPPAVAPDGTSYVGTSDGSVEAITAKGTLEWSYMVDGPVVWAPVLDATGRLYVATSTARLYSFGPTGALGWQIRTPTRVATDPVVARPWGVVFGGSDASVWAYSAHAGALWHVNIGGQIAAGPVVRGTRVVVATASGDTWLLDGAMKLAVARLGVRVRSIAGLFADGSAAVIAGDALERLDAHGGVHWRRDAIEWATAIPGGFIAIDSGGVLVRLGDDGSETSRTSLGVTASDAPVIAPSGAIYLSTDVGDLVIVNAGGSVRRVHVASASLKRPVLDVPGHRVIVAAGDGTLTALKLEE